MLLRNQEGYKKLILWQNLKLLRKRVYDIAGRFPGIEHRRVSQMNDAARSAKQNIQEGYGQTILKYLNALNIAHASLHELHGDIEDCYEDQLITEEEFKELDALCGKTDYLFKRLIQSLQKFKNPATPRSTPSHLAQP
ncbi:MAG: four helix bundle protein [bacterium]|nr:four helix bundle protein [bacterium]